MRFYNNCRDLISKQFEQAWYNSPNPYDGVIQTEDYIIDDFSMYCAGGEL